MRAECVFFELTLLAVKVMTAVMLQPNRDAMSEVHRGRCNSRGVDKFGNLCTSVRFRGEESKGNEWMVKCLSYTRSRNPQSYKYTKSPTERDDVVNKALIHLTYGEYLGDEGLQIIS